MKKILSLLMFLSLPVMADQGLRLVVPFPPGGSTDSVARIISGALSHELQKTVTVENRSGAGGAIATKEVAMTKPDGSTLLMSTVSTFGSNHAFMKDPGFDPLRDFEHIVTVASTPKVMVVRSDFPANSVKELVGLMKKHPAKYKFGTSGRSADELYVSLFRVLTETDATFVAYKGGAPALIDLLGGHTDILIDNLPLVIQHVRDGRVKILALSWPERLKEFPTVPTWGELGYADLNISSWQGIVAPRGLAPAEVDRINLALRNVLKNQDVQSRLSNMGFYPVGDSTAQSSQLVKQTYQKMTEVGQRAGLVKN